MKRPILSFLVALLVVFTVPTVVYAGADPAGISVTICELEEVILNLFNLIIAITPFIGLAILLYGAVIWMTAAADPQRMQLAQSTLTYGVIGLVLGLSAILIVVTIESFLLSGESAFRWSEEGGAAFIRVQICDEDVARGGGGEDDPCDPNPCGPSDQCEPIADDPGFRCVDIGH
ncbi:unnamed protein product [marine sediment metagenome]|uniref:Uncharacterized protein n=1 Tax=marine sediment metagenome TaxID=412755 RepID=X1S3J6_9ZZZZ